MIRFELNDFGISIDGFGPLMMGLACQAQCPPCIRISGMELNYLGSAAPIDRIKSINVAGSSLTGRAAVPDFDGAVRGAGGNRVPVGTKCKAPHLACGLKCQSFLTGFGIPYLDKTVRAAAGNSLAIGTIGHADYSF